jgi:hypothetical protein
MIKGTKMRVLRKGIRVANGKITFIVLTDIL